MRRRLSAVLISCSLALGGIAHATYSIVGGHPSTKQVGGAGISCVAPQSVYVIYGGVPGKGAVHAQANYNQTAKETAKRLLGQGDSPDAILQQITVTAPSDRDPRDEQYGVIDLSGRAAGYTGSQAQSVALDRNGRPGDYVFSAQGNILTGSDVVENAAAAFAATGCDLADKLMLALEAGAKSSGGKLIGDSRCTPRGIPGNSAFLQVDREGEPAGSYLKLTVENATAAPGPIATLRRRFDEWRVTHPCPGGRDGGAPDGGALDAGAADAAPPDLARPADAAPPSLDGSSDLGQEPKDGAATAPPIDGGRGASKKPPTEGGGCALAPVGVGALAPLFALLLLSRSRRR